MKHSQTEISHININQQVPSTLKKNQIDKVTSN